MKWIRSYPFVISASLHGGELVVSYPFDFSKHPQEERMHSPTPDEQVSKCMLLQLLQTKLLHKLILHNKVISCV